MNQFINKVRYQTRHTLWYAAVVLFGIASFFGGPKAKLQTELQDAMLLAKSYQVDEVDVRKDAVEDASSLEDKKAKRLTGAQPRLVTAPFVCFVIWNKGEDIAYLSSQIDWLFKYEDHLSIPLGSMAPPIM